VFGWSIDEERSYEVLDAYVEAGGNFIDTADSYGRNGPGGEGESERIIGRWMAARENRDRLVIATKVGSTPIKMTPKRRSTRRSAPSPN
jgi:aryl-alcohol dehydrogenase-like predicted oxidoreductase